MEPIQILRDRGRIARRQHSARLIAATASERIVVRGGGLLGPEERVSENGRSENRESLYGALDRCRYCGGPARSRAERPPGGRRARPCQTQGRRRPGHG